MIDNNTYFVDFEFIEDGKTIDPISIGILCNDGRSLYLINKECNFLSASDWVIEHVLTPMGIIVNKDNHLMPLKLNPSKVLPYWSSKEEIKEEVIKFVTKNGEKPTFIGYYADYDWVTMAQLFGKMIDLPKGFPMYCKDLKQWIDDLGNPLIPESIDTGHHHALLDAVWVKNVYVWLQDQILLEKLPYHPEFVASRMYVNKPNKFNISINSGTNLHIGDIY